MLMERIIERTNRRAILITKLQEMQKLDMQTIGIVEPVKHTKETILKAVLKCHQTDFDSVFWKYKATGKINRKRKNVKIRQMYFYLCRKMTNYGFKEIGHINKEGKTYHVFDHSTIIHAVYAHEDLIECYKSEKNFHDSVVKYLQS